MPFAETEPLTQSPQSQPRTPPRLSHLRLPEAENIHIPREAASEDEQLHLDAGKPIRADSAVHRLLSSTEIFIRSEKAGFK